MLLEIVYLLCLATSAVCAWLLMRSYLENRTRLLLWSAVAFGFLALNNLFVVVDLIVLPGFGLVALRHLAALAAAGVLLFGLIWESE